jgi:hypothetical protein
VKCRTKPAWALALKDFVINGIQAEDMTFKGGPVMGRGMFMPEFSSAISDPETGQGGHPNVHYTTGAGGIVIEIDKQTGKTRVLKAALAVDVGDNGTRELFESILKDEEIHIDWLEAQLDQIKQMGIQNYLVEQVS